jgi:hypothetical protein
LQGDEKDILAKQSFIRWNLGSSFLFKNSSIGHIGVEKTVPHSSSV